MGVVLVVRVEGGGGGGWVLGGWWGLLLGRGGKRKEVVGTSGASFGEGRREKGLGKRERG